MFSKSTRYIMAEPGISPTEIDPKSYNKSVNIPWFTILMVVAILGSVIYAIVAGNKAKAIAATEPTATITTTPTTTESLEVKRFEPSATPSITLEYTLTPIETYYPTETFTPVVIQQEITRIVEVVRTQVVLIPVVHTVMVPIYMTVVVTATSTNTPTPTMTATSTQTVQITNTKTNTPTLTMTPTPTMSATPTIAAYP
jgi:hypothetical protein